MSRQTTLIASFAAGWVAMALILLPLYEPQIIDDYARMATMAAYLAVVGLVVFVAMLHQAIYRDRARPMMPPLLVWGMGASYALAAGMASLNLWERLGEPLSIRPLLLGVSLVLALCWLVPLVLYLQDARYSKDGS